MRRRARSYLITDAERSQDDQLRKRRNRYVSMMGLRAVCLIAATVLVGVRAPLLWLWLSVCGLGMVLLPWLAVILANDRPPKEKHRLRQPTPPAAGTTPDAATTPQLPSQRTDGRVIDADQ